MSAPLSAYHSEALKDKTTPQNYLMCKFLAEYTNIKTEFYLDAILRYKDGATFYFGGACFVGSKNSKHHANSRKGQIFDELEVYTDGGLNTLAHIEFRNLNQPKWVNWINLKYFLLSAYYNDTSNFGYSYKINAGAWVDISVASLGQKLEKEELIRHIDLTPAASEGDTINFRMWATNSEGTRLSDIYSFTALETLALPTGSNVFETIDGNSIGTQILYMLSSTEAALDSVSASDSSTGLYLYKSEYFNTSTPSSGDVVDNNYYVIGSVPKISSTLEKAFKVVGGEIRKYEVRTIKIPAIRLRLVDTGSPGLIVPKVLASVINNDGGGFRKTMTLNFDIEYYNVSDVYQTKVSRTMPITLNNSQDYSGLVPLPPAGYGIKKVKVVCTNTESEVGMAIEAPALTVLPFYYDR